MKSLDPATLLALQSRDGLVPRLLFWISARNLQSGQMEEIGIWSGEEDRAFPIDGAARTYLGAGTLLRSEPISAASGLEVRLHQVELAAVAPEVEGIVRGYDTRFAPVEMHRALFDPAARSLVAAPERVFRGLLNSLQFPTAAPGEEARAVLELASAARRLTRTLAIKKSDESQSRRGGDRLRRYGNISGSTSVYWGERRFDAPAAAPPSPPTTAPGAPPARPAPFVNPR